MNVLQRLTGNPAFFPYYHLVSESVPEYIGNSYPVMTPEEYEKQLDWLLKYYRPVDLLTLIHTVKNKLPLPKNSFHLTFDDGYRQMYEVVFPILKRKGIPATFFICSDILDNKKIFWENQLNLVKKTWKILPASQKEKMTGNFPESVAVISDLPNYQNREKYGFLAKEMGLDPDSFLKKEQPYLTSSQIREMIASGYTFGSHSIDHPLFKDLSLQEQIRQIEESCGSISETFQLDYRVFAFPYGEFGVKKALFDTLHERGKIDLLFGTRGIIPDSCTLVIQRFSMEQPKIWKAIRSEMAMKWIRRQVSNDKVIRRH